MRLFTEINGTIYKLVSMQNGVPVYKPINK